MFRINISKGKESDALEISFDGTFTDDHKKRFLDFNEHYEIEHLALHTPILEYKPLKRRKDRTCRFCQKSYPDVTFNNKAHTLPQLIGNTKFESDEECDSCNLEFGRYETDLSYFLGITRTLARSSGKVGIPKFKNPDKKLIIQESLKRKNLIEIISEGKEFDHFKIDLKKKTITIEAIKASYIPINVYKSLLKIALSLIPLDELHNYEKTIKFLKSTEFDAKMKGNPFIRLFGYFIPGVPFSSPTALLWKKRESSTNQSIPARVLVIYFQTYVYQIFITHDMNDQHLIDRKSVTFKMLPPFMDKSWIERFGEPGYFNLDLSDSKIKKGERQEITLTFDSINLNVNQTSI